MEIAIIVNGLTVLVEFATDQQNIPVSTDYTLCRIVEPSSPNPSISTSKRTLLSQMLLETYPGLFYSALFCYLLCN